MIELAVRGVTSLPWEEVKTWDPVMREAAVIAAGISSGGTWDYEAWCWVRPR